MSAAKRRLIGLDPGLRFTGWGIVDMQGSKLTHVANGAVRSEASLSLAERLLQLDEGLDEVVQEYAPDHAAVEKTFVNRDGAALKLGQARAVCLLARRGETSASICAQFHQGGVTAGSRRQTSD